MSQQIREILRRLNPKPGTIGHFILNALGKPRGETIGGFLATALIKSGALQTSLTASAPRKLSLHPDIIRLVEAIQYPPRFADIDVHRIEPESGVFPSGVDSSALIKAVSVLTVSAINVSGPEAAPTIIAVSLLQVSGNATISGPTTLASTLEVSGKASIGGALDVAGLLSVNALATFQSGLNTSAVVKVGGALSVVATGIFQSGLSTSGGAKFGGTGLFTATLELSSHASVAGNANVYGNITASGTLTTKSDLTVSGTLTVSGPTTLASTLEVSGKLSVGASAMFQSGLNTSGLINAPSIKVLSYIVPAADNTASIGTGALRFATVRAVSVIQNDVVWTDPVCELCGEPFASGQIVALHIAGVRHDEGNRIKAWEVTPSGPKPILEPYKETLHGGRPVHMQHLVASMIRSALGAA